MENHYNFYTGQLYAGISFQQLINYKIFNNKLHFLKDQTLGETEEGVEVKMDNLRKQTGNFYIEVAERRNPSTLYCSSGIFRTDNTAFWLIGDYTSVYILKKETLVDEYNSGKHPTIENVYETSLGFLIKESRMEEIAPVKVYPDRMDEELKTKINDVFFNVPPVKLSDDISSLG